MSIKGYLVTIKSKHFKNNARSFYLQLEFLAPSKEISVELAERQIAANLDDFTDGSPVALGDDQVISCLEKFSFSSVQLKTWKR